jgi:hypothetical protein
MSNDKKTALQQLKSTIKDGIGNMNGQLNDYKSGYKQCLIDIENLIDKQLLKMDKEQIMEAHRKGQEDEKDYYNVGDKSMTRHTGNSMEYYEQTYGGNK